MRSLLTTNSQAQNRFPLISRANEMDMRYCEQARKEGRRRKWSMGLFDHKQIVNVRKEWVKMCQYNSKYKGVGKFVKSESIWLNMNMPSVYANGTATTTPTMPKPTKHFFRFVYNIIHAYRHENPLKSKC